MNGIHWMASAMQAAKVKLEVAADNLANASTDAFHRRIFAAGITANGLRASTTTAGEPGAARFTGRTMDLALLGPGAFTVAPGRDLKHAVQTRAGAFACDRNGYVVDAQGRALVADDGRLVRLERTGAIEPDGSWRAGGKVIARIALPRGTTVRSGFLESSNVNAIGEMVDVIDAQRAFESAQKTLSAIDETRSKSANEMGEIK
jgi:flagellar basal-body rod protein FlgG